MLNFLRKFPSLDKLEIKKKIEKLAFRAFSFATFFRAAGARFSHAKKRKKTDS
ncbi:MAG: hypothetical protein ABIE14_02520 [Patescibacteria group bacterium]